MKRATLGKIAALVISASALNSTHLAAQTTCSNDMFGNTNCTSTNATTIRGSTDMFGNQTWQNNQGTTTRGSTDMFGNTTYRDNRGNTMQGSTDMF